MEDMMEVFLHLMARDMGFIWYAYFQSHDWEFILVVIAKSIGRVNLVH